MDMKLWFRKITVVLITILTLGMYVPPIVLNPEVDDNKDEITSKATNDDATRVTINTSAEVPDTRFSNDFTIQTKQEEMIERLTHKARDQRISKLGTRSMKEVEQEIN